MNNQGDQNQGRLQKLGQKTSWINAAAFILLIAAVLMFIGK